MSTFKDSLTEFKKLKNESWQVKLEYILTYYRLPILIILTVLVILISQMIHFATMKETVLSGRCINAVFDSSASQQFLDKLSKELNIDEGKSKLTLSHSLLSSEDIQNSIVTHQLITAEIAANSLDFLICETQTLLQYAYDESFADLRTILSQKQVETLSPYFLYIDMALANSFDYTANQAPQFPDPTVPEAMAQPVPFAMQIPEGSDFDQVYYSHTEKPMAIAVLCNAPNVDTVRQFISLLFK